MPDPNISVLMAVYNGEKSIRKTIESVLHQTYSDFEFIIVDDGSTDETLEIAKALNLEVFVHARNYGY
ncbi:MAG: glycosyltransferase family 2 protein, partial [bacterium]|nr:glycosyltransferase family 2 protein [bacterium]